MHSLCMHSLRSFPKLRVNAFTLKFDDILDKDLEIVRGAWLALNSEESETFVKYQICKQAVLQTVFGNHTLYLNAVAQLYKKYNMKKVLNLIVGLELKFNGNVHRKQIGEVVWTGLEYHRLRYGFHIVLGGVAPRLWIWRSKWGTYHIREVELVFDTKLNLINSPPYDNKHLPKSYCSPTPKTIIWF